MTDGEHVDASRWTKYKVEEQWDLNTRLDFSHKIQPKKEKKYVNLKGPEHCVSVCARARVRACFVAKISSAQRPPLAVKLIKRDQSGPQKAILIH